MKNKQYWEIDKIERKGSQIAARITNKIRGKVIAAYEQKHAQNINIGNDIVNSLFLSLLAASIVSDLKGRKRSFLHADASFDVKPDEKTNIKQEVLELAYEKKKHPTYKRVLRLPIKKYLKKEAFKVFIEDEDDEKKSSKKEGIINIHLPKGSEAEKVYTKGKDVYTKTKKIVRRGKETKRKIQQTPIQYVGEKSRIKPVPGPETKQLFVKPKRKGYAKFQEVKEKEHERIREEIKEKLKKEKKYIYDEVIRHLRVIFKDVIKEGIKVVNWQEVLDRLTNDERNVNDIRSLIKHEQLEKSQKKLITKLINKVTRKIRDKKNRAKEEIAEKLEREGVRATREYIYKPYIKQPIRRKIEQKLFGVPRKAGSHRQYRGVHYHITKNLQELERGQKRRRLFEKAQRIYGAVGGIADLTLFLSKYDTKDVFAFLTELGGATFFPETYKIGGVIKAANYVNETARILEITEDEQETQLNVKEYQVKRTLQLIQELQTIKKLFQKYSPPVYDILQHTSTKVNDNLRQTVNDLILSGTPVNRAKKVLNEAFRVNGLTPDNPYHVETIYRTQSALAYSAGRWQADQHPAIQEILWGYKYITVGDSRVRMQHRMLDGVTLPKEDEFWLYFWPPNGWNCRCGIISLFEKREIVLPPKDWKGLAEIDKNFTFNPGLVFTDATAHLVGTRG